MLFIVGTILFVQHGFRGKTLILHLVRLFVLTALLVMLPQWGNQVQQTLQNSILDGLGVDPSHVQDQYNQLLAVKRDTGADRSWWDILGDRKKRCPKPSHRAQRANFQRSPLVSRPDQIRSAPIF